MSFVYNTRLLYLNSFNYVNKRRRDALFVKKFVRNINIEDNLFYTKYIRE